VLSCAAALVGEGRKKEEEKAKEEKKRKERKHQAAYQRGSGGLVRRPVNISCWLLPALYLALLSYQRAA